MLGRGINAESTYRYRDSFSDSRIASPHLKQLPFGRLPGDIAFKSGDTSFFFPIVTCVIISIVLSLFSIFQVIGLCRCDSDPHSCSFYLYRSEHLLLNQSTTRRRAGSYYTSFKDVLACPVVGTTCITETELEVLSSDDTVKIFLHH